MTTMRTFATARPRDRRGVACDADGAFVDAIPLLKGAPADAANIWMARGTRELSSELSRRFGVPIDMTAKTAGLNAIARALNAGDIVRAQLLMVHPDIREPPGLSKSRTPDDDC
ncbi:MAG: hypothetical protein ABSD74_20800 [Rhizomicrobium sp.]|jgi:hypothetical protein